MKQRKLAPGIPLPAFRPQAVPSATASPSDPATADSPATFAGRNQQMIAVDIIDPNPLAPREVYTPAMILDRAEALRTQGQHDAIHVIPHPEVPGRYIICDGWTRVLSCQYHKVLDALLAEIHLDITLQEAAWFGYQQNEERQQHCDLDRAMFYEKLIAAGESASEVSRRAKLSRTMMSFYRAYARLPEDVLEIIRQQPEKFGANAAYNLFKLYDKCGLRKTISLAAKYAAEDQPLRWLVNQVQALIDPAEHKSSAPLKHIRYANGYFKHRGDGFEVSIAVSPEKREAFAQALEDLLDTVAVVAVQSPDPVAHEQGGAE